MAAKASWNRDVLEAPLLKLDVADSDGRFVLERFTTEGDEERASVGVVAEGGNVKDGEDGEDGETSGLGGVE